MIPVYLHGDHMISPLGEGSELNFAQLVDGKNGVKSHDRPDLLPSPFVASLLEEEVGCEEGGQYAGYTRLETLLIRAMRGLVARYDIPLDRKTAIVVSTTKGNIGLLHNPRQENFPAERVYLSAMARQIQQYFNLDETPMVLSNACISGALALSVARQLLQSGRFDRAIVVGGDELSAFVLSGFHAFQAMSDAPCRPYDRDRKGINLGEAAVAVWLSTHRQPGSIAMLGVGSYNDANHISGPSRTGEGLFRSMQKALSEAGVESVDYISAHGTATLYNDEMEAIALGRSGLAHLPLHSLKGYYGHTLGASGLLETVIACHGLRQGILLRSPGYEQSGTSVPLNIITQHQRQPLQTFMKLASGFGGTNIAAIFRQV